MKTRLESPRARISLLVLAILAGLAIVSAANSDKVYSVLDRAFYLDDEDASWIRPGNNIEIQDITIPPDLRTEVTFRLTDDRGQPLDRNGDLTPGTVRTSWLIAYIPQDGTEYVSYITRQASSSITGLTATQATSDSGGTYTSLGDGTYLYKFGTALPSGFHRDTTHSVGVYSDRNLTEFGLSNYIANEVETFVPDGRPVTKIREIAVTESCNQCHDPLTVHGRRQKMELCILCHTPQSSDPDTGNTVDMKVMVHKIHRGANLPSVLAGMPYQIIGFGNNVHDYSEVHFPQDVRNCESCHKDAIQGRNWLLKPTRATCGSCHDDVNFTTGENHAGGRATNDDRCAVCHLPQGEFENDASISGAHTVDYKSTQLRNPMLEILGVTSTGAGASPVVTFRITDKDGGRVAPLEMGRLALVLAGPTSDYNWFISENARTAAYANGVGTYTFSGSLPSDATGTYSVGAEGYLNTVVNPGTTDEFSYRDAIDNPTHLFAVTGSVMPRRAIVDIAKCNECHDKLQLHGGNRNQTEHCVTCHNPTNTDVARRPESESPPEAIDFKMLIHKLHTGHDLNFDYTVYGFGGTAHNYNELHYPGDRRNCAKCHVGSSYTVPLAASVQPSTSPRHFWDPILPTAAACLACHDSLDAAVHAFVNTAVFGESCSVCHKEAADFAVSKVHAR